MALPGWTLFLEAAGGVLAAFVLHELTHLAVARVAAPIDVSLYIRIPS